MPAPDIDTTLRAIDHASAMSDRWLFIAVLLILMAFAAFCIKWLVKQNESQREEHSKIVREVIVVLHDATVVMKQLNARLVDPDEPPRPVKQITLEPPR